MTATDLPSQSLTATAADPPEQHVRVALDVRLRALLRHENGVRDGTDPEDLHQMRVAVRRMRAVLRAARPLLDRVWADGVRAELGWLGGALGPARDADVLLARLRGEVAALGGTDAEAARPLLRALEDERTAVRATMLDALDSDRYRALLALLAGAVAQPLPASTSDGQRPALAAMVAREFRRLRVAVREAGDNPSDEVLHELRIYGKRLRYTTELAEPGLGRPARKLLKAVEVLQDVLGEHQDACVAQQRVRALAAGAGVDTAFAAGRLVEREQARRAQSRAAWPAAWRTVANTATQALAAAQPRVEDVESPR